MHIVFNSDHYHIVEYPTSSGYEVFSKDFGRMGFISGDAAEALRRSIDEIVASGADDDSDAIDDVLSQYDALLTQSLVVH